jgi:DNA-binding NarL/FixJ family response regulator
MPRARDRSRTKVRALPGIPGKPDVDLRAFCSSNEKGGAPVLQITPWERAALQLLANGIATHELAGRLGVSESEIEVRMSTLFARMGAASRSEAIAAALRRGLLIPANAFP